MTTFDLPAILPSGGPGIGDLTLSLLWMATVTMAFGAALLWRQKSEAVTIYCGISVEAGRATSAAAFHHSPMAIKFPVLPGLASQLRKWPIALSPCMSRRVRTFRVVRVNANS